MARFLTVLAITLSLAAFVVTGGQKAKAGHSCGDGCDQYTAEGACTHGCNVPGAAPNPDYHPPEDYASSTAQWTDYYQNVQPIQQAAIEATEERQAAIANCMECVNCPDDHLKPACAGVAGGHNPLSPAKPDEPGVSFQTNEIALRDEADRIIAYNTQNNITDGSGNYNFFAGTDGNSYYLIKQTDGTYDISATAPGATGTGGTSLFDRSGVWGEFGTACLTTSGIDPDNGDVSAICTGTGMKIYACSPDEIGVGPTRTTNPDGTTCNSQTQDCGGGPICKVSGRIVNGTIDCVAEANRLCSFVQIDVPNPTNPAGGSAVTCYPTSSANCGEVTVTASYTPPGSSTPPADDEPGPSPTPTGTSGYQCQQIKVYRVTPQGGEGAKGLAQVEITPAEIRLGDEIIFRAFASATGTTVSKIKFILNKGGVEQAPVEVATTLVGGIYQADYTVTISGAVSHGVVATPISP